MASVLEHAAVARIGPNAITRVAEVLRERVGADGAARLFSLAGLAAYVERPPQAMVDEAEVTQLHAVLRASLGAAAAARVAREAGTRTGDYLLAHRIPKPVQALLKMLPATLAARVLLGAITRHAWTFAGSGEFVAEAGRPVRLAIRDNPMCRGLASDVPACDFYAATFERLFRALVHPRASVVETACEACGDDACHFAVRW
ncbi:bacteriochlorophyll 4-vinyl reductase [Calidifontimicrobium sp. SYSU G02091]|uniref:bacteriochlorophyll 4-vinyl reductase n=1 Tax=Calidifontimicrobium sp. SYSU G02091 TaxID=2926421 RepID=UPI001F5385F0|nr:bacteriochlorophyll 4-vinyl reductase [Calidifontimicrobium sp. SYSU G02091]